MEKVAHIVLLRVFAITLVVLGHATRNGPNSHMYDPTLTPWWEATLKNYIYSFHMPLFFVISGFVFYYSVVANRELQSLGTQILKKIKRLVVPMYSTSLLVLLPTIILFGYVNESIFVQAKLFIYAQNNDHLWFLKTLFIIFLGFIPLYNIVKNDNLVFYILLLSVIGLMSINRDMIPALLVSPIQFVPFFTIGCLLKKYDIFNGNSRLLILFIVFFLLHFILLLTKNYLIIYLSERLHWFVTSICGVIFIYCFVKIMCLFLTGSNYWKLIAEIDKFSYSIYLFHVSFLYVMLYISFKYSLAPCFRVILSFILGYCGPIIVHIAFRRSRFISRLFAIKCIKQ